MTVHSENKGYCFANDLRAQLSLLMATTAVIVLALAAETYWLVTMLLAAN